jgi:hypothetical protein
MCSGAHVKYRLFVSDFNETLIFSEVFEKYANIKFHENPSSGSRIVPCGGTDGRADMTKLIVAFRNFANAPKKENTSCNANIFNQHCLRRDLMPNCVEIEVPSTSLGVRCTKQNAQIQRIKNEMKFNLKNKNKN